MHDMGGSMKALLILTVLLVAANSEAQEVVMSREVMASLTAKCESGDFQACNAAGTGIMAGRSEEKDIPLAGRLLAQSCDSGNLDGCRLRGLWLIAKDNPARDVEGGFQVLKAACLAGIVGACNEAAAAHLDPKGAANQSDVVALYRRSCEFNNAEGCAMAGAILSVGSGVPKDIANGAPLLDKACALSDAKSCAMLGIMHFNGSGVPKDEKKANAYADRACNLGYTDLCS